MNPEKFLENSEHTGRHIVRASNGKLYYIEPVGYTNTNFGDVNPATKQVEGGYGQKYKGSVSEGESMITGHNGFDKIYNLSPGESPYSFIEKLVKQEIQ